MTNPTACSRHDDVTTRLRCAVCDTPICPDCTVEAPIGLRCPDCGRSNGTAGLRRRPDQIAPALGVAVLGALLGGGLIGAVQLLLPIGGLFVAYLVGIQVGRRVRAAAGDNTVDVVRWIALGGAGASALVAEVVVGLGGGGAIGLRGVTLLAAGAAIYGAWSNLR